MIIVESLKLVNFQSFKNSTFEFSTGKPVSIQGVNLSDDGQQSNGSGKSALQEALYRCWVGTGIRKGIRDKDLIRNDESEAVIENVLLDTLTKDRIRIKRTIRQTKSETVELHVNDVDQSDKFATVNDANKYILDNILCTTKEDIDNIYIVNSEKYTSFFFSPDSKKKELIGRFSNANIISGVELEVEKDTKIIEQKIQYLQSEKSKTQGKISVLSDQISDFDIRVLEQEKQARIETKIKQKEVLLDKNTQAGYDIIDLGKEIESDSESLQEFKKQIKKANLQADRSEIDAILEQINDANTLSNELRLSEDQLNKNVNALLNKIASLQNSIRGEIVCPKCKHTFVPNKDVNVEDVRKSILESEKAANEFKNDIKALNDDLSQVSEIVKGLRLQKSQAEDQIQKIEQEANKLKRDLVIRENSLISKESAVNRKKNEIMENINEMDRIDELIHSIREEPIENPVQSWQNKLNEAEKELKETDNDIQNHEDALYETKQWIFNFKRFASHLANKSLKVIEQRTNEYLLKMKSNLAIRIDGVKVLADGSLRENITPTILRDGFPEGGFGKFSGGERVRVDVANLIARQSIINDTHQKGGIDLLWIDEVLDKSDAKGLDNLLLSCENLQKTILLTSHIQTNFQYNTIRVVKENGISKIV